MKDIFSLLDEQEKQKLNEKAFPEWMAPQLATLTDKRFSDENWIYERKLDGERCIANVHSGRVMLYSRNQQELNTQYPEIVEELLEKAKYDLIIDGEIVAFENDVTSFSKLQSRMHASGEEEVQNSDVDVFYYIFDILYLDTYDVTQVNQRARKSLLKDALDYEDPLRYLPHRNRDGEEYFKEACRKGWEGIIAKDATAAYAHSRSRNWLKFKCVKRQEMVIGGYTEPEGKRIGFGALLLGFYEDGDLHYAGKVGTGFDDQTLNDMKKRLSKIEIAQPAFAKRDSLPRKDVHWTKPELVAQIGFEEWTKNDRLRQPRYLGLRDDKDPKDVKKEVAQ